MKYPVLDFLRSALIPELRSDITARSARHVHLGLVAVVAVRALPKKLPVLFRDQDLPIVSAYLTEIALRVKFGVHNIVINILYYRQYGGNIILHIGNFHIRNCAARRKLLELALEFQLRKRVDLFRYMHVVAVCDIIFIGYTGNDTESALQTLRKFIGRTFKRRSVEGKIDIFFLLPLFASVVSRGHTR